MSLRDVRPEVYRARSRSLDGQRPNFNLIRSMVSSTNTYYAQSLILVTGLSPIRGWLSERYA